MTNARLEHAQSVVACALAVIALFVMAACGTAPSDHSSSYPPGPCIGSGDETAINRALNGRGAKAFLCPHAVFEITHQIVLSADDQELATRGTTAEDAEAMILVVGSDLATAISSRSSNVKVHDLIVDGARSKLGRIEKGGSLIEVGGETSGVQVDHVRAFDPRGWSVLHVFEGARNCTGARITNNTLGPAGAPDGAWADGISFACRNGLISHNTVTDASDGAIVLFGAPGTLVEDNVVQTSNNQLLGGINLVDYKPFDGDFTGTTVRHNRIIADRGFIKVGIAIGPTVWGSNSGQFVTGAVVTDNVISGDRIGYGIAIDGATAITVTGNRVLSHPNGHLGPRCIKDQMGPGHALVRNPSTTSGAFQDGFDLGPLRYSICIVP